MPGPYIHMSSAKHAAALLARGRYEPPGSVEKFEDLDQDARRDDDVLVAEVRKEEEQVGTDRGGGGEIGLPLHDGRQLLEVPSRPARIPSAVEWTAHWRLLSCAARSIANGK